MDDAFNHETEENLLSEAAHRFVFVSYASKDRSRVLPIVDQIQAHGFDAWIDRNRIPGGADYTQEIPGAIAHAACVVVCLSVNAFESRNVNKELLLAWKKKKAVIPLLLDDVPIGDAFEYVLEGIQHIRLFETSVDVWWADLELAFTRHQLAVGIGPSSSSRTAINPPATRVDRSFVATPLMPYLVNRWQQEEQLRRLLEAYAAQRLTQPMVILTYGRSDQAVHEYLDRLERSSLPRHFRRTGYRDLVTWKNLPWPRGEWHTSPNETVARLRAHAETEFELSRGTFPKGAIDAMTTSRCPIVACVRLRWHQWNDAHLDTLTAWISDWGDLSPLPVESPVLVVVAVEYSEQESGWLARMLPARRSVHPIHAQLRRVVAAVPPTIAPVLLTELGDVTLQDIEDWILHDLRPPDPSGMIRRARELLGDPLITSGAAMQIVADRLSRLLSETAQERTH